jgi:outer membrane protein assembly factor BamB
MMLRAAGDAMSVAWKGKSNNPARPDIVHAMMSSPVFSAGTGYANGNQGELVAFDEQTGEVKWKSFDPLMGKRTDGANVFIVPQADRYVMFNDQGELILAQLSPEGYRETDRAKILEPVGFAQGRDIVWSHPAFARRCMFARNDQELVCVSLAAEG